MSEETDGENTGRRLSKENESGHLAAVGGIAFLGLVAFVLWRLFGSKQTVEDVQAAIPSFVAPPSEMQTKTDVTTEWAPDFAQVGLQTRRTPAPDKPDG